MEQKRESKMVNNVNAVFYATIYHPIQAGSIDGTDITPHDNGVYRALLGSATGLYDPLGDPKAEGDPYCSLFVGRLSARTDEKSLHEAMSKFGKVKNLRLVRHIVTGASCGYAFVEFETDRDMRYAYENAHGLQVDGARLLVDYNRQQLMPGWIPRRLGGGLGGKKESGQLRFGGRDRPFRASLRPIPEEELKKLGIPLPPEGHYMSRFEVPPPPQRKHISEYDANSEMKHHREEDDTKRRLPSEAPGEERARERDRPHRSRRDEEMKHHREEDDSRRRRTPSEAPGEERERDRERDRSHRSRRDEETDQSHRSYHRKHESSSRYDGYEFEPKRPASGDGQGAADTHHSERKRRKEHSYEDEGRTRHGRWQPQDDPDQPPPDDHYRHRESKHHRPVSRESESKHRHGESKHRRRDEDEAHRSSRKDKHYREEKLDIEQKERKRSKHRERERERDQE